MNEEVQKAIKALEAAARKAARAGVEVRTTYTVLTPAGAVKGIIREAP